ncbi:MAG: OmpH family outer membrane protein [bacterium]|nr:OmpH family outer membrane protein [bacterium]
MRRTDRIGAHWARGAALVVAGVLACAGVARADSKVGIVDMQRALNECDAGRRAKDQVKSKFERAQNQLKNQREELDRAREDYEKRATVMREEQRRDLEKDLEGRTLDFKRKYEDFQRDLKRTDAELTSGIVEELYNIVADYGQQQQYTFILEASSGALLYGEKSLDITDEIIRLHNGGAGRGSGGKRAPSRRGDE